MDNVFWLNDPNVLVSSFSIWPMPHMNKNDKFNAISRLIFIMTFLGIFITKSVNLLITGVITLAVIAFLYYAKDKPNEIVKENFSNPCPGPHYKSVPDNPLSNVQLPEIQFNPTRNKAPLANTKKQEKTINQNTKEMIINTSFKDDPELGKKLFKDLGDKINFDRSMLNFNTTANTTIPNDQKGFAEFCYGDMPSCKEGSALACEKEAFKYLPG
jgi:hypothetical protein